MGGCRRERFLEVIPVRLGVHEGKHRVALIALGAGMPRWWHNAKERALTSRNDENENFRFIVSGVLR